MLRQKRERFRSDKYGKFVKSLPCCVTGMPADTWHHIKGYGLSGARLKASDLFTMPIKHEPHMHYHSNPKHWEELNGSQLIHVGKTINKALIEGVIDFKFVHDEIEYFVMPQDAELIYRQIAPDFIKTL